MSRLGRSFRVQPGTQTEGLPWAKELAAHVDRRSNVETRVLVEVFGEVGAVSWGADHEDLGTLVSARLAHRATRWGTVKREGADIWRPPIHARFVAPLSAVAVCAARLVHHM